MMAAKTPTIVFVNGAWADATGFDAEIRALQNRGYTAIGFGNPRAGLGVDPVLVSGGPQRQHHPPTGRTRHGRPSTRRRQKHPLTLATSARMKEEHHDP